MKIINANLYRPDFTFRPGGLAVENGRIVAILEDRPALDGGAMDDPYTAGPQASDYTGETIDLGGRAVIPGLVDVHHHGDSGADFCDGKIEHTSRMLRFLAQNGITSISPASLTLDEERLAAAFRVARDLHRDGPTDGARLVGITMEGPFFNAAKKGAQNADYLRLPDFDLFTRLNDVSGNLIQIVCVAPELDGALDFIRRASRVCTVSIAHTNADYDQARQAIEAGARHVTHLFNTMPPLGHRAPSVIGAAAEHPEVLAELIVDGVHIHPSAVRTAFALFGAGRIVLVSDSMAACGMHDGQYELGGLPVKVQGRKATLRDGTIAGSATHLYDCLRTAIAYGIPPEHAVRAATANPARQIGAADVCGKLDVGRAADFLVCNRDWSLDRVYLGGQRIR